MIRPTVSCHPTLILYHPEPGASLISLVVLLGPTVLYLTLFVLLLIVNRQTDNMRWPLELSPFLNI